MVGVVVGLVLGAGLCCVWWACWVPIESGRGPRGQRRPAVRRRLIAAMRPASLAEAHRGWRSVGATLSRDLALAGLPRLTLPGFWLGCLVGAVVSGLLVHLLTGSLVLAAAFALLAGYLPTDVVRVRAQRRVQERRALLPDVADNIAAAVRAGMALPEAVAHNAVRGPMPLRPVFAEFAQYYRITGRFGDALDQLKDRLADPVADRLIESLRLARDVGGSDLGLLSRTLSGVIREDGRTRAALEAHQNRSMKAARLAAAAPWVVLAAVATQQEARHAYHTTAGVVILAGGLVATTIAYGVMRRLGRLPTEERVLG